VTAVAVSVYQPNGSTLIAGVPRRRGVKWTDELNGDGTGSFEIHLDDALLTTYPTLLSGGNIVKFSTGGTDRFAFQIESVTPALTTSEEKAGRFATVAGRGVRTLLATAALHPEYGITANSADDRGFTAASNVSGPWYVSADWITPVGVLWTAEATARATYPDGWVDPTAYWVWSTDPDATSAFGRNWFTSTFTLASAQPVSIYAAADDILQVSLDGDVILESDKTQLYSWREMTKYTAVLSAGIHTLAARVDNVNAHTATNVAGFLCAVYTLNSFGDPSTLIRHTDTTNWKVHGYAPPEPGWHVASILKQAITEAQARSVMQLAPLTFGFTDTLDTAGAAWTDRVSERFPIGEDLLTLLGQLIELGMDVEVTPALVVNAWARRGTDLTASVTLGAGNVLSNVPTALYGAVRNSALMRHGTGWVLVEDSASVTGNGRRETGITIGGADSDAQATLQAQAFFAESAKAHVTLPISMTSAAGPQPYTTFNLGDTIMAPGFTGTSVAARLMSINANEQDGYIAYDLALYPVA
jgi:hypothetical protein